MVAWNMREPEAPRMIPPTSRINVHTESRCIREGTAYVSMLFALCQAGSSTTGCFKSHARPHGNSCCLKTKKGWLRFLSLDGRESPIRRSFERIRHQFQKTLSVLVS
ncbi:hypothetical protein TNCV_5137291 [Trichonephila clavipes]|nr:hypothetical protein TNCV_5137291 [Trichonephila clavipes]